MTNITETALEGEDARDFEPGGSTEIPLERLCSVTRLPLSANQITTLSKDWEGQVGRRTWTDIQWIAQQFLSHSSRGGAQYTVAWYHLVMAVGNLKRSTGPIYPEHLPFPDETFEPPLNFTIPGTGLVVEVADSQSWRSLTTIRGLGVPTATTLLSAVWPGYHVILDRRDAVAAVGVATELWNPTGFEDAKMPDRDTYDQYWDFYEWFLATVKATARDEVEPVNVERALYMLDIKVRKDLPKKGKWQWSQYRDRAVEVLAEADLRVAGSS